MKLHFLPDEVFDAVVAAASISTDKAVTDETKIRLSLAGIIPERARHVFADLEEGGADPAFLLH